MDLKTKYIMGLNVRYLETRGQSEIPLIILHGWGGSIDSWTNVASALEEGGMKVFIPDLPGFGETPEPPHAWGCAEYLDFIKALARELGITKFVLAGHSFGGQIAITYAAKYPGDLQKLILMAAARIIKRKRLKVRVFLLATKIGNLIFSLLPLVLLRPLVRKIWYKLSGEHDYYRASPLMKETMRLVLGDDVAPKLGKIQTPTLILWGDSDVLTPLEDARIIHDKISDSKLYIFTGVGHDLNFKKPREIAQKVVEFITHPNPSLP
ncbi:MAG: alpha/beta hydrolase [Candidatus Spechtbacterales bacterium]